MGVWSAMKIRCRNAVVIASLSLTLASAIAQERPSGKGREADANSRELLRPNDTPSRGNGTNDPNNSIFRTEVPDHPFDIILGRPTNNSVTASVLFYDSVNARIVYGAQSGRYTDETSLVPLKEGEPMQLQIGGLKADTQYFYQLQYKSSGAGDFTHSQEFTFHTARPPGSAFTFTVQADSHLDFGTVPQIYRKTLENASADKPDFHFELGDTFMTDKYPRYTDAAKQYVAQRYYFGVLCHSAPLFFVIGNHDGEAGWKRDGVDSMAVWSNQIRKRYFPNPYPDNFYTGNTQPDPFSGRLEDYYAWQWGDALFIALDPFWYTTSKPRDDADGWSRTLGREQYDWLSHTLEASTARFKFVFIHHLVGGLDKDGRGGSEAAKLYEWGGNSANGQSDFAARRPGWGLPIHELLVKHHVSAVLHGHDHLYVRQELDGIMYLEVPQPSHPENNTARSAADYGYTHGVILGSPGHVRVRVSSEQAVIDYVRSRQPYEESQGKRNGEVADSFVMPANVSPAERSDRRVGRQEQRANAPRAVPG